MNTIKQYIADGTTALFNIPFPYLDQGHVGVSLNGFPMNFGAHFEYVNGQSIRFRPHVTPVQNVLVEIKRETPIHQLLVQFQNGATLTQEDLNTAALQSLYSIEELWDRYEARFGEAAIRLSNGNFTNAQNLIDAAVASVLDSQLLADLQSRISDIDFNGEAILQQTSRVNTLQSTVDALADIDGVGLTTFIQNEQEARIDGDEALAQTIALVGVKSSDGLSFIVNTNTTRISPTETLATRLTTLQSAIDTNEDNIADVQADITAEASTRATQDTALATQISSLSATVVTNNNAVNAAILSEQTTRANADSANATLITNLTARVGTAEGNIVTSQAAINTEATTRANADSAFASTIALLGAKNAGSTAFVLNTATTLVDATTSLATRLSGIEAKADAVKTFRQTSAPSSPQTGWIWIDTDSTPVNLAYRWSGSAWESIDNADIATNKAAIITEQTARANGDSALASSISTLQTTVNGHTSSISTIQTTTNGLIAQYMVKTDVNGHVAGFGLYNEGGSSQFIINASKFAVAVAGTTKVPFVISGGVCYMQNVVIQDALIENLTVGKLTSGILTASITQNADINVGTGRIIWSNGSYMKVAGVGFGSSSQFIEWFGPVMSISSCSEANAIYYLKTNGSAYFGGALSAGALYNARSTSDTLGDAQVTVGPFGTNGNSKLYVLSYSCNRTYRRVGSGNSVSGTMSATVKLYRKIGSAAEVEIVSMPVTGSVTSNSYEAETNRQTVGTSMSGSTTYTDNVAGTDDRTLRAALTARSLFSVSGSPSGIGDTISQNITATSQEG